MATEDLTPSYYMVEDEDSIDMDLAERINQFNWDPDSAGAVMALFPVDWTGTESEVATLRANGTVALDLAGMFELPEPFNRATPPTMITTTTGMAVLKPHHPHNVTIESGFRAVGVPVPDVVQAMNAREAARTGDQATLHTFVSEGVNRHNGWREPISTALLGNWADSLYSEGVLSPGALDQFWAEARIINRQIKPLWLRQANRGYVRLLDTPFGEGMTLYDVLSAPPSDDPSFEGFEDDRLIEILKDLSEEERMVVIARSHRGVTNWPEAARAAGVPEPEAVCERVRRKVNRLVKRINRHKTEQGNGRTPSMTPGR